MIDSFPWSTDSRKKDSVISHLIMLRDLFILFYVSGKPWRQALIRFFLESAHINKKYMIENQSVYSRLAEKIKMELKKDICCEWNSFANLAQEYADAEKDNSKILHSLFKTFDSDFEKGSEIEGLTTLLHGILKQME